MSDLLPCPFCGGSVKLCRNTYGVECRVNFITRCKNPKCGAFEIIRDDEAEAVRLWNTRTPGTVTTGDLKVNGGDVDIEAEVQRTLAMSDDEIWAEAVREHGSPEAALKEAERIRMIIQKAMDKCLKIESPIKTLELKAPARSEISVVNECREAFEANTRKRCGGVHDPEHELRKKPNGEYAEPRVYAAWTAWQDCWEVRSPKPVSVAHCVQAMIDYDIYNNSTSEPFTFEEAAKAVLDAAGVKYV